MQAYRKHLSIWGWICVLLPLFSSCRLAFFRSPTQPTPVADQGKNFRSEVRLSQDQLHAGLVWKKHYHLLAYGMYTQGLLDDRLYNPFLKTYQQKTSQLLGGMGLGYSFQAGLNRWSFVAGGELGYRRYKDTLVFEEAPGSAFYELQGAIRSWYILPGYSRQGEHGEVHQVGLRFRALSIRPEKFVQRNLQEMGQKEWQKGESWLQEMPYAEHPLYSFSRLPDFSNGKTRWFFFLEPAYTGRYPAFSWLSFISQTGLRFRLDNLRLSRKTFFLEFGIVLYPGRRAD
jgi:hypothetical protein